MNFKPITRKFAELKEQKKHDNVVFYLGLLQAIRSTCA